MKPLYTICYVSKSSPQLTDSHIDIILEQTASNNNNCNVSGILLHSLDNFFQVLEGQEDHLLELFEKIKKDPRHHNIYEIYNKHTVQPVFLNYKSTFDIVKNNEDLKSILAYLEDNTPNSTKLKLKRLLQPFDILGEF